MIKLLNIQELQKSKWPELLHSTFGENLVSAFLHGNCLMEGFSALDSPWTVSFILKDNSPAVLAKAHELTKQAKRENIQFGYFFTPTELLKSLDTFPLEYLHIANRSAALCGIQPLAGFVPERAKLRLQCERELRGILVHLREGFVNTKAGKALDKMMNEAIKDILPVLYGVYFLETGTYPESHQQVFERHPELKNENLITAIEGIVNKVDSMEEK